MQWLALEKVDKKEIQFFPDSQEKIFREWLGNIQDWCLSHASSGGGTPSLRGTVANVEKFLFQKPSL